MFGALSETSLQTLFAAPPRCSDLLGVSRSRAGLAHGGGSSTGGGASSSVNESVRCLCAQPHCNGPLRASGGSLGAPRAPPRISRPRFALGAARAPRPASPATDVRSTAGGRAGAPARAPTAGPEKPRLQEPGKNGSQKEQKSI